MGRDELTTRLDRLERKLDALLSRERPHRRNPDAQAVSKRQAARILGVHRGTTLATLIASGALRTVEIAGRVRVPRAELERVLQEGVAAPGRVGRRSRPARRRGWADEVAELRRMRVEDL